MNDIILISYLAGSSGQFLEHFLMKHDGIFKKEQTRLYKTNEWAVSYADLYDKNNCIFLEELRDGKSYVRGTDEEIDYILNNQFDIGTDTLTISCHELEKNYKLENKNVSILGIDVEDNISKKYIRNLYILKENWRWDHIGNADNLTNFYKDYESGITSQNVPYYFINYKKFFIEQELDEYINLCKFLNIKSNIKMYMKNIDYYMYENDRLLDEHKLL